MYSKTNNNSSSTKILGSLIPQNFNKNNSTVQPTVQPNTSNVNNNNKSTNGLFGNQNLSGNNAFLGNNNNSQSNNMNKLFGCK